MKKGSEGKLQRVSISIPKETYDMLEELVEDAGYDNRSKAVADLITQAAVNLREEHGNHIMAGTITLVCDGKKKGISEKLSKIKTDNINEVISTYQVLLYEGKILEILLVQGSSIQLKKIKDLFAAIKGVISTKLTLTQAIIPPLHQPKNL